MGEDEAGQLLVLEVELRALQERVAAIEQELAGLRARMDAEFRRSYGEPL